MRVLLVVRRSARLQRSQTLNQLRHLVFCAPEPIRVRFKDRTQIGLIKEPAAMRPNPTSDPVTYTTNLMIRNLARRIRALTKEVKDIDGMLKELVEQTCCLSTGWDQTEQPPSSSQQETTQNGSDPNGHGPTSAE
jgi:hypothetical protein